MTTWTSGYIADLDYTHGFYRELTPNLLGFVPLIQGKHSPDASVPLAYCELGCGQGFSANLLAAANPHVSFYATDFNPTQIAGAKTLAAEAGTSNAHFFDQSFEEFRSEPSLPNAFDIIALHGIYSWISPENRSHIVEFIRRKLKPGGLVYISYNTLPGWAAAMPLRQLMVDHAATSSGPIAPRIDQALAFVEQLRAVGAKYFPANPPVNERLDRLKGMSRNYLAHEYFNRDWTPFYHADVVRELNEAKLSFAGTAHFLDQIDAVHLTAEQQALLAGTGDVTRREGLRDFIVNQQFRRDVFIKGPEPLNQQKSREQWLDLRFALSTIREDVPLNVTGSLGEATLQPEVYTPLLDTFASGPKTGRQLISEKAIADLGWQRLTQALTVLVGSGHLQLCLPAKDENKRTARTKAFNGAVMQRAQWSADLGFLASPLTGGGIIVDRFSQLFLLARSLKQDDPIQFVWNLLSGQGQRLVKEGVPLGTPEENLTELSTRFTEFSAKRLPVLQQLGIA